MKSLEKKRIFGLDLLRAIAISLVVVSHCTYILFPENTNSLVTLIRVFGAIGVDLFFVLSGFLIGGILLRTLLNNKVTFSHLMLFWKRRWLRTLPNYILILIVNILLGVILGYTLPDNIANYFVFFQNFTTPHPDFFTEAWSLSIEEYAYILLPLVLFLSIGVWRKTDKSRLFFIISLASIILLFVFKIFYFYTAEVNSYKQWSATYRKVVVYRLDAIYIGFLVAYLTHVKTKLMIRYNVFFSVLGGLLLLFLHVVIYWCKLLPQTHLWFYVFIYLSLVVLSLALVVPYFSMLNYTGTGSKLTVYISKISYSIYLINYSIVLLTLEYFYDFSSMGFVSKIGVLILFLVLTIILSSVVYKFFERPIMRYRHRKYPS